MGAEQEIQGMERTGGDSEDVRSRPADARDVLLDARRGLAGAERLLAAEGMAPRAVKRLVDACDLRKGRSTLDLLGQRGDELVQVVWMVSAVRCVVQPVHLNRHAERHLPFAVAPVADLPSALALVVAVAFKPLSRGFPTPPPLCPQRVGQERVGRARSTTPLQVRTHPAARQPGRYAISWEDTQYLGKIPLGQI